MPDVVADRTRREIRGEYQRLAERALSSNLPPDILQNAITRSRRIRMRHAAAVPGAFPQGLA